MCFGARKCAGSNLAPSGVIEPATMESEPLPARDITYDRPGTKCWNLTPKECPFLQAHRIARIGIDNSQTGYERVRIRPSGSFFMETSVGEGRILLEGKWQ